jgi:hypothetical protein
MESRISLALATKLRKIFETEDKYLTFPLGTSFTYQYLNFMKDPSISGLTLQEHLNNKGDFARLLNIVPSDATSFSPDASKLLWDELINILRMSTFAKSNLTVEENNLLNKAVDFLTDITKLDDGTEIPVNSVIVNKYYEYKTVFDQAEATYLNEKMTVELSTGTEGEKLKQQWNAYREKQLLDIKNKAEDDWKNLGLREQVKYYQQVRSNLEPRKFLGLYKSAYLNEIEISETPDLNGMGIGVYTTFFSPFDAFEPNLPWMEITLSKEEINQLVQVAPNDLKSIFNAGEGSNDIESIKLEYKEVVIIRPWYKPEFFASRYWKFDDDIIVSDGHVPRQGKIPGYITSMLVVRKVMVIRKKTVQFSPITLPILTKDPLQTFIKEIQKKILEEKIPKKIPNILNRLLDISLRTIIQQPKMAINDSKRSSLSMNYMNAKYAGITIKSPIIEIPKKNELPSNQNRSEQFVTETLNFDGVIVLAYICKRVPKSPNPDLTLVWT